jgi:hypothetical protein
MQTGLLLSFFLIDIHEDKMTAKNNAPDTPTIWAAGAFLYALCVS